MIVPDRYDTHESSFNLQFIEKFDLVINLHKNDTGYKGIEWATEREREKEKKKKRVIVKRLMFFF